MSADALPYDPALRRDTPLALKLKERIRREGPLTVADYMKACLHDPEHGYYRTQQAIGAAADFVTAPEISQVFGELIGLWCAVVWQQMGSPPAFNLIELGPGRGTMMADALRAMRTVPGCIDALSVWLVETNRLLADTQRATLSQVYGAVRWVERLASIDPPGPSIFVANEFLDTRILHQHVFHERHFCHRTIELDASGLLAFGEKLSDPMSYDVDGVRKMYPGIVPGDILGTHEISDLAEVLPRLLRSGPQAGLFLDYGHLRHGPGDMLQAVRQHLAEHPLTSPGEADLSAQVDFNQFGVDCGAFGYKTDGPVTQGEFLGRLGVVERASKLMSANPHKAGEIETGVARLMAVPGMGDRFKVIGIRSPSLPRLPGF